MSRLMPPTLKAELVSAAKAGRIVVLEIEVDGVKLYARSSSCLGPEPTTNPLEATNYARHAEQSHFRDVDEYADPDLDEYADPDLDELWYDCASLYIKGEGGGKSSLRSDIPGRIVVFEKRADPPIVAVYTPETYSTN